VQVNAGVCTGEPGCEDCLSQPKYGEIVRDYVQAYRLGSVSRSAAKEHRLALAWWMRRPVLR
jgi:hypothetical protein